MYRSTLRACLALSLSRLRRHRQRHRQSVSYALRRLAPCHPGRFQQHTGAGHVVRFVRDRRGYKNAVKAKPGRCGMSGMVGTNVVLGDQETGTSWQQASGEAIEGPLKGRRLTMVTFIHTTWGEWRAEHPRALIMLPAPGREESYAHYKPMLATASQRFRGAIREDLRRPRFDQITGIEKGSAHKAYPLDELKKQTGVNDRVGASPVLVTYSSETGTVRTFLRDPGGRTLTFRATGAEWLTDTETKSKWNRTGLARTRSSRRFRQCLRSGSPGPSSSRTQTYSPPVVVRLSRSRAPDNT